MSGRRRHVRPPWPARRSARRFVAWCNRESGADRFARLGAGSVVYPPALVIGPGRIAVGEGVVLHPGAFLSVVGPEQGPGCDGRLVIGDGVQIGHALVVACAGRVEIGPRVLVSDRVFIGDTYHEYRDPGRPVLDQGLRDPRPVRIGSGAFLGIGAIVLPGVSVGENAYVGAGAVVTSDVPARAVAVGNPARVVRQWDGSAWREAGAPAAAPAA